MQFFHFRLQLHFNFTNSKFKSVINRLLYRFVLRELCPVRIIGCIIQCRLCCYMLVLPEYFRGSKAADASAAAADELRSW